MYSEILSFFVDVVVLSIRASSASETVFFLFVSSFKAKTNKQKSKTNKQTTQTACKIYKIFSVTLMSNQACKQFYCEISLTIT